MRDELAQDKVARATGGFYLGFILASFVADTAGHVGVSDPQQVYETIGADLWAFRLALVIALISAFLFLMAAWGLFVLLRPVNRDLALVFLLLNAVGVGIQCASMLWLVSAMLLGEAPGYLQATSAAQLDGLTLISVNAYKTGFVTAQLFFGTWLFPLGYLVYKSGFLPRFLGVLLVLDGFAILIWFLQALLWPDYEAIIYPGLVLSFVAEVGLGLWLLVKGVRTADTGGTHASPGLPAVPLRQQGGS
jgi:hypothetical protein